MGNGNYIKGSYSMKKITVCFFGTYDKTYTSNKMIIKGLEENGVKVVEINSHIKVTKLTTVNEMSLLQIVKRVLRKYKIIIEIIKNFNLFLKTDLIYVGYPGHVDVFFAYPIAKLFRKKLVFNPLLIIYNGFADEQGILNKKSIFGKAVKILESTCYKLCDLVFADTSFQYDHLKKDFNIPANKLRILSLGADDADYKYTPYENTKEKKVHVVYYGLYSPVHGVEHIVEAANILRNDKDIRFSFVGQGNTFEKNYKRAQDLKLSNITFHRDVYEIKNLPILQSADIFLGFLQKHPTVDRVIPNKVYQGLALGRVVLTADSPITRSVFVSGKDAYLCKPSDPKALANAIVKLKNNPKLRTMIALNGYNLYKNKFTPYAVGKQLITYISEIL